jgi:hypothetical protein
MIEAIRDNPKRAPHWRWLRALQIDSGGMRARRALDGPEGYLWIRRALRMKRRYEAAGNRPDAVYGLMLHDRDMFWAYHLWLEEKQPTRWMIEARVIAGESDEEIASKLGTEPAVIAAYVNVFFDTREKLNNLDYVSGVVLADAVTRGLQERHYDLLWKMLGYVGGAHVLDATMRRSLPIEKPKHSDQVGTFFQDFAVNTMKYKAALSALTVQINTHTQLSLIDSFVKYVEIERTTENAAKAHTSIVDNIGEMLKAMPFRIGTKLDAEAIKVLPYDTNAAELKNDELMIVTSGGELTNQTAIQQLNFPEKN